MLLITKELAEALIDKCIDNEWGCCNYCDAKDVWHDTEGLPAGEMICDHDDNCIVVRAKLLLEKEWGVKS